MMLDIHSLFSGDPFKSFYNLDGLEKVILTTDIDWAPDYATEVLLEIVDEAGMKITAFATHDSPLLRKSEKFVEIGLHPDNTRPDPVHLFSKKLSDLLDLYPDAQGLRCHRNFFGQNISDLAKRAGLLYDISTFLPSQPFCQAHTDYNGITKMSYVWEDGIHVDTNKPLSISALPLEGPGLKVFNVHPMLIYLNAPNDALRKKLTQGISDLTKAPESHFQDHIYKGYGLRNLYIDFLSELRRRNVKTYFANDVARLAAIPSSPN